ncbi:hypothetical protein A7A08_01713 [Methyloligella halotolerans]|uniref:Uncharacterized protein n=1 Tax=Methyloligella halotolerans TaxID=1177755 RepID=A0A1E2S010_9HYPH|nr:hypothetical protein [Methyloligella halotolerans]ODA67678.1 hypothetical protein A7A08_01713 [Methyloligella halotolerans]
MLDLSTAQRAALASGQVKRALFLWCDALDPDTGGPAPAGFWTGKGSVEIGGRTYYGSGALIKPEAISAVSDMSIQGMKVTLSGLDPETNALVRGSTVGQRPIELHTGIFDPRTHELIGDLIPRFVGIVDDAEIVTPEAGGTGGNALTCESHARALTISRTDTRSSASQHQRDPNDDFYKYTSAQRGKPIYFGRKK